MRKPVTVCVLTDEAVHAVVGNGRGTPWEIHRHAQQAFAIPDSLLVDHDPEELASAVARTVKETGRSTGSITLVIPVQWCFAHVLERPSRRMSDQALAYEFEQFLPLSLEEVTWAFASLGSRSVLGAAVPLGRY